LGPIAFTTHPYITQFFAPLPNSPLINTATVPCSPFDQRRAIRLDACDKGAIEFGVEPPSLYLPQVLR
jgi:hypothetical protein